MKLKTYLGLIITVIVLSILWWVSMSFKNLSFQQEVINYQPNTVAESEFWDPENVDIYLFLPKYVDGAQWQKKIVDINNDNINEIMIFACDQTENSYQANVSILGPNEKNQPILKSELVLPNSQAMGNFDCPSFKELKDVNQDSLNEILINLGEPETGVSNFGIFSYDGTNLNWVKIEDVLGNDSFSIFSEGSSEQDLSVFELMPLEKGIVQFKGTILENNSWSGIVDAYIWQDNIFKYDQSLSEKLKKQGPTLETLNG